MEWVALLVLVALGAWLWATYNRLIRLRNDSQTAWHQVETELQQRLDLVPNLVRTVKGYASHERQTLEAVTAARSQGLSSTTPEDALAAGDVLTRSLSRLLLLQESYPQLRADTSFLQLQTELSEVERRINLSRRLFNETVRIYNTGQQEFPANLVARLMGHAASEQFSATPQAHVPPTVDFR